VADLPRSTVRPQRISRTVGDVTLFAGRINADGTFADAEADAEANTDAYGLDGDQLAAAARGLWERLDDSGASQGRRE
jgi:hypothetical protein